MDAGQEAAGFSGEVVLDGVRLVVEDGRVVLPRGMALRSAEVGGGRRRVRAERAVVRAVRHSRGYDGDAAAARVVEVLGNNVTAGLLGVAKDRPSRWAGGEAMSPESRARLAELDSLLMQLLSVFTAEQAALWLEGEDPFLQARPLDVFAAEGSTRVVAAMRAYEQGAFA